MATSITQAKPLLTAAELELFNHSRAEPIKELAAKQLAGKEKRTRALRDKYRDLYRRQTLAVRGKAARAGAMGDANARTQRKAEIMQEMLDRYEARSSLLAAREERAGASKGVNRKATSPAAPAKPTKSASRARKPAASTKRAGAASAPAPVTASLKASSAAKPGKTKSVQTKTGKPLATEQALSAVASLKPAKGGLAEPTHFAGMDPAARSLKAPSPRAPTYGGKTRAPAVNAPLDIVPSAKRVNPVKNSPGSLAIQGHVSSNVRRSQGKRDSR